MASKNRRKMLMPVSNATNAYDLLTDVAKLVLDEPRRLKMDDWITPVEWLPEKHKAPACGTVGCIAGWVSTLTPTQTYKSALGGTYAEEPVDQGCRVLGVEDAYDLFTRRSLVLDGERNGGTLKHARNVVKAIKAFQKGHEKRLREKSVRTTKRRKGYIITPRPAR